MLLILFAGVGLPAGGHDQPVRLFTPEPFWQHLGDVGTHMILPALTLDAHGLRQYTLVVRSSMLETLGEDYVLTARAKGLPVRRSCGGTRVRNAMLPMVTLIALYARLHRGRRDADRGDLQLARHRRWPCTGHHQRDYPMLQGGFLILTVSVILLNFVADLLYFRLDPRITA